MLIIFKHHTKLEEIFDVNDYPIPREGESIVRDNIPYIVQQVAYDYDDYECRVYLKEDTI